MSAAVVLHPVPFKIRCRFAAPIGLLLASAPAGALMKAATSLPDGQVLAFIVGRHLLSLRRVGGEIHVLGYSEPGEAPPS